MSQLDSVVPQAKLDVTPEATSVAQVYSDRGVVIGVLPFAGNGPRTHWRDLILVFGQSVGCHEGCETDSKQNSHVCFPVFKAGLEELARFSQPSMKRGNLVPPRPVGLA